MAVLFFKWAGPFDASVLGVLAMLGVVHNWAFHPVVVAAAGFALAWRERPVPPRASA
jgi:hypothetical protein